MLYSRYSSGQSSVDTVEITSVSPADEVPIGTKVTLTATTNVTDPTWDWNRACDGREPWLLFPDVPPQKEKLIDCVGDVGTQVYRVTVRPGVKDDQEVKFHPPDNIVLTMARASKMFGGTAFVRHNYKFRWGQKPLGPCAVPCVQESITWDQSQKSIERIGKLSLIDIPKWWPPCPIPSGGVVGNPDIPELVSWKWDSPNLVDYHGLGITNAQLQKCNSGFVLVTVKQIVRATGSRCNGGNQQAITGEGASSAPDWSLEKQYIFEWFVTGQGSSVQIGQRLKE